MAIKPDGCIVLVVAVAETRVCCLVRRADRVPRPRLASDGHQLISQLLIKHEAGLKGGSRRQIRLKSRPVYTKIGGPCR